MLAKLAPFSILANVPAEERLHCWWSRVYLFLQEFIDALLIAFGWGLSSQRRDGVDNVLFKDLEEERRKGHTYRRNCILQSRANVAIGIEMRHAKPRQREQAKKQANKTRRIS